MRGVRRGQDRGRPPARALRKPLAERRLSEADVRRLAVLGAGLGAPAPSPDREGVLAVVRQLAGLQIDPTRTVEKTHLLVLWSRLGRYETEILDRLLWDERVLFEYAASIQSLERLPELRFLMARFASGPGPWQTRVREWLAANHAFRRRVLGRLKAEGPLASRAFTADAVGTVPWPSKGWTGGRNVTQMLEFLHQRGEVMVAARAGNERIWDLAERVVPELSRTADLTEAQFTEQRITRLVRRLGIANDSELRVRVPLVDKQLVTTTIARLVDEGGVQRVATDDGDALVLPDAIASLDTWRGRTTLLSPFDPLIHDRERTERLFGFSYRLEMYVPKEKRQYGHFVLPILHGDRLIGRVSPSMDRRAGLLTIEGVHAEPDAPATAATARAIRRSIEDLGAWLGAREIVYSKVPAGWRALRDG